MDLQGNKIILASQSPRRKDLLEQIGLKDFEIIPTHADEHVEGEVAPDELVKILSRRKAEALENDDAVIISADTVVSIGGKILGKPKNAENSVKMLKLLSGKCHQVYTGITVRKGKELLTEVEKTDVYFRDLSDEEIRAYVQTGEPFDKAGGYGIQNRAAVYVKKIDGDYGNVVGLPLYRLADMLEKFGVFLRK